MKGFEKEISIPFYRGECVKPNINTLVFIGPHGAGKTTLGTKVSDLLGWRYEYEIGKMLRLAVLRQNEENHALVSHSDFDREVFLREMSRDYLWTGFRVVETWHLGNLAYAEKRSPEVAARMGKIAYDRIRSRKHLIAVQPLRIERETALQRLSEPGPDPEEMVDFFLSVGERTEALTRGWGLYMLPAVYTDQGTVTEQALSIVGALRNAIDFAMRDRGKEY